MRRTSSVNDRRPNVGLTPNDLQELLNAFEESTWQEMTVSVNGDTLSVSRRSSSSPTDSGTAIDTGSSPTSAPSVVRPHEPAAALEPGPASSGSMSASADQAASDPSSAKGSPVPAPSVGLFWHAPSPGAPPFVEIGSRVGPEDVVGIVEVMKLMNRVTAGLAGVVSAVLVENGGMVEHGQPVVLVDTDA
jgi:acetyl-CoA carboxylase biotin carboxyl carrier protein